MRRKEKEIKAQTEIEAIIDRALVCRLALYDGQEPYLVPLCFGYQDQALYFHSAPKGRKVDILKRNARVCFEIDIDHDLEKGETACQWGMHFSSVIGFGRAEFLQSESEKKAALDVIMAHYSDQPPRYAPEKLAATLVIKVTIESMTAKRG
jgi:nitroimidazol reductase NimA-like FMN-containing flavoprotein (pyridoxamine 5'-phosphate oxidase superfamily)